jgi:hypothetical protein
VLNDIQADGVYKYYSYLYGYTADEEGIRQLAGQTAASGGSGNGGGPESDVEVGTK